ncbi:MAG: hypothetical protein P8J55_06705 [Pseudomonadales bacterium]|nr:hypothetical protein [Pseudomonadales bacterium]
MDSLKQILEYQIISFGDQAVTAGHVAAVPIVFVVGFIFLQWLIRIVSKILISRNANANLVHMIRRAINVLALVVLLITILDMINMPIAAFAFISGAVAIGVGAQNIINNFISV